MGVKDVGVALVGATLGGVVAQIEAVVELIDEGRVSPDTGSRALGSMVGGEVLDMAVSSILDTSGK